MPSMSVGVQGADPIGLVLTKTLPIESVATQRDVDGQLTDVTVFDPSAVVAVQAPPPPAGLVAVTI